MAELNAQAFEEFFESVWGYPPFAWQAALARHVLGAADEVVPGVPPSRWPHAIALPTASGKTACIDVAVFALAAQAGRVELGEASSAPRRIFFVVDRRVIVDEAYQRAFTLASKLAGAQTGVVKTVADRLRALAGSDVPLTAHQLRGGMLRSEEWALSPVQPMVVASTVDQVGSRLLFRGYGPGGGMWPVHAGLVANDSLILLDEAHCAQPFLESVLAVSRYRAWAQQPLPAPFEVAVLSATPPAGAGVVFRDESGQGRDPRHVLGQRQLASKPAALRIAEKAKGKNAELVRAEVAKVLASEAMRLASDHGESAGAPAIVVFCNRVDTARKMHALIAKMSANVHLLTGRMRPLDKDDVISTGLAPLAARCSATRRLASPCFVVATQTLEVGADLDFDLLVTECASLDALRQRFGRLNRMGRAVDARAAIVVRGDQAAGGEDDPVYGPAVANTWRWMTARSEVNTIDFGIAALDSLLPEGDELIALNAPAQHAPVLLPAHVDALVQTSPVPVPSPDVALFLHGPRSGPADVQICWRADLTGDPAHWIDAVLLCPPSSPECMAVPFAQMRRWLNGEPGDGGADLEGEPGDPSREPVVAGPARSVLRWRGRENSDLLQGGEGLRPGDVLVIPANLGGLDELATLGAEPVPDWGDRAHALMRNRALLRLHPAVVRQWPASQAREELEELALHGQSAWEEDPPAFAEALRERLSAWAESLDDEPLAWLRAVVRALAQERRLHHNISWHPAGGLVVAGAGLLKAVGQEAEADTSFGDEDDQASSGHFRSLLVDAMGDGRSHLEGVGHLAAKHGRLCGLPADLVNVLDRAGCGHDLGKADPRFQAWLRGGNPWAGGPLLAKSVEMPQSQAESRRARERAGYPDGGRHELLSVRLLESANEGLPADQDMRDLLLHLVESHHGHCRPFAPVVFDEAPVLVTVKFKDATYSAGSATGLEQIDAGPAERFWRLTRRYGWWGLAWLESLLRLADHRRSAWEQWQAGRDK